MSTLSSLQRSKDYIQAFWPLSSKSKEPNSATPTSRDDESTKFKLSEVFSRMKDFDQFKHKLLDSSFKQKLHKLYLYIARDESRVFVLLDNDVISLLARLEVSSIPLDAIEDHIAIFQCLLSETTKIYDDSEDNELNNEFNSDTQKISKNIGVFLINYLKHQRLPLNKIKLLASFVYKLAQYFLTMTKLVDGWLKISVHEPDVIYLLYKNKLGPNCFPMYELAKDFLFSGQDTFDVSRDILLHIVLTTGFSESLENWLLTSEFPGIVSTGLLSGFNQLSYNESLLDNHQDDFDDILTNSLAFNEFDDFVLFILDIIAYSTHDSVKSAFLNCFEKRFIDPILEAYTKDGTNHLNTIFLLSHAFRKMISPKSGSQYVIDEFVEKYFDFNNMEEPRIMELFITNLAKTYDNPVLVISTLKLFDAFTKSKSLNLLSNTFSDDRTFFSTTSDPIIQCSSNVFDLSSKVRNIITTDSYYNEIIIDKLDESLSLLSRNLIHDPNNSNAKQTWIQFSSSKLFPIHILFSLLKFFTNSQETNRTLIQLIKNVTTAHGGRIFNFVVSDTGEDDNTPFGLIFEYLWKSYQQYSNSINKGSKLISVELPKIEIIQIFEGGNEKDLKEVVNKWLRSQQKAPFTYDKLALNVQLFQEFTIDLYALHISRNIYNGVSI
ncbi:hypothetical protein BN7_4999 [Wickerhamomyces ciferrii]|uniref:Uncharacterized protein n=1 Tax=Wickerhamomyces ciferrii (strain ATCC 14091 / BCRC 22168 / CBS 111 / JCM 3599 / NBRC 0793 / NRRL Y-1031 F-60-10) TaxID=1206466 RepID=K0KTR6_WICCF|nr:uncharacterized protein BN7_4999 [Wickerhamomyces ciferrii]CCH45417.1 hypothetical protein BN7_4999 [Wickerhamomyces ciferrii]